MLHSLSSTMSNLFFFIIFHLLVPPAFAANSSNILYEIEPFIRVYKNGSVERLTGTETTPPSLDPKSRVLSKDIIIDPSLNISARLYLPKTAAAATCKLPLLVYFHGGAFFTSSPFTPTYHNYLNSVVAKANVVAVSVNYSLAPEHPLPAAYEDSWLALKWVFSHSGEGGGSEEWLRNDVDFERVYLSGDSAGGNIAHNVAVRVGLEKMGRDDPGVMIRGLFLNCPHFWGKVRIGNEASDPKMVAAEDSIWVHAYPNSTGFDDPLLNPDYDPNLWRLGCKKVVVYVGEKDILRDRGLEYTKALRKSKWEGVVKGVDVKGAPHVFNLQFPKSKDAHKMLNHFALFLNDKEKFN
ncbi:probable carboxylesterase 12 [Salvia miltiorrhiza]|uniref:probable carboxylesterase 12 n=1 Tax=Salvia miltiorrhiza TaxID=226208 RepID=UPI0025AC44F0|nr:probable carboxylesterase 12 [Salvia miltiorrhiza]